ncbi:ATP-binding cassette domain-containing protein [Kribbella sp. NBC_01245]|uniref:ABC transporter ATP-binding protein n=1 Tax=Kribbella sp. NBC_01245 TaxID=2903578 RepID=UPI002E2AE483|nr:ATP-binding cassette domain-containing protein [Kribbella sp. NBC_01245]
MTFSAALAVSARGLRKTYRSRRGRRTIAVQGLDMDVPAGGVHGFLGPNGSGKTTSIRMLLGLVRADAGTMTIFGQPVPERLPEVVGRVGAIVESPKFFPAFSGRKNLELLAEAIGTPRCVVDEVLEETSLGDRGRDRFKSYSLGMKQRLAIAAALLKQPDLLIFDEPTNGLDPAGIREIRETMRGLGDRGKTVLVSSHILAEVEQVADTVSIIGHGRLLASGTVADVIGSNAAASVRLRIADREAAVRVLTDGGLVVRVEGEQLLVDGVTDSADVTRRLAEHGLYVAEIVPVRAALESVFLELTAGESLTGTKEPR